MNIVILHGDDTVASRQRYYKIISSVKGRGWSINKLDKESQMLSEILTSQSLFDNEILAVADFKFIDAKDLAWLKKNHDKLDSMLLIYSNKKLTKTQTNKFPNTKIESFELPQILFKFLETVYPGNSQSIKMLHELLTQVKIEFVFIMLARQFRDLILVKHSPNTRVMPSWRVAKLKSQAAKFKEGQLEKIIEKLAQLDIESKTGKADLLIQLELLFAKDWEV